MPTTPVAANAAPTPIDRRLFLAAGSAAAVFGALYSAKAESPDAELFALARRAKALYADLRAAENDLVNAEQQLVKIAPPEALIVTASDKTRFSRIGAAVGEPFTPGDVKVVCSARDVMLEMCSLIKWDDLGPNPDAPQMVARAVEIEAAQKKHIAEKEATHRAAGLPEAEEKVDRLDDELSLIWRELTFTPARTIEGILAKLDAASAPLAAGRLNPDEYAKGAAPEDVAWMAAADLAALNKAGEA